MSIQAAPIDDKTALRNYLTRKHTAFDSFDDLINAAGGYEPTIRCMAPRETRSWDYRAERLELLALADHYDGAQEQRGDPRRAYRGTYMPSRVDGDVEFIG